MSLKRIILYGHLRKRFGREFRLDVASASEAFRSALPAVVPGFREYMVEHSLPGYRVFVGDEIRPQEDLEKPIGREVIKIVPVVAGAKGNAFGVVAGAVLVALSFVPYFAAASTYMRSAGISMMLGGVATLLANNPAYVPPAPEGKTEGDPPAYSFNGPHMTVGQGNPVPVLLGGPLRIGGALVSMGISAEEWPTKGLGGLAPDELGTRGGNGDTNPWVWAVKPA